MHGHAGLVGVNALSHVVVVLENEHVSATLLNQPFFSAQEITLKLEYVILR